MRSSSPGNKASKKATGKSLPTFKITASCLAISLGTVLVGGSVRPVMAAPTKHASDLGGLGLHVGNDNDETLEPYLSFGEWLGRPVQYRIVFADHSSWPGLAGNWFIAASKKWIASDPKRWEVVTLPLVPDNEKENFQPIIDGKHDAEFRAMALGLKDSGIASRTIVRLGWEFNGNWFAWSALNDPKGYIAAFRRAVKDMRSVVPDLKIDWCVNRGPSADKDKKPFRWTSAYPGDDVVDIISMDVYDQYNSGWDDIVHGDGGLRELRDFAAAHHKKEAYPEWGCSTDAHGHGDSPEFIDHMADWFRASPSGVVYQGYWNTWAGGPDAVLHGERDGKIPKAAAEYKRVFGG